MLKLLVKTENMEKTTACLELLVAAFGWSLSTILIKRYIGSIPAYHLLMGRFIIGALFIFLIRPSIVRQIRKPDIILGIPLGLLMFASYALGVISLKYTSASKSGFLVSMSVLFIPIVQTFIRKKLPGKWTTISVVLSLLGLRLISGMNGGGFNVGDVMALGSAATYTAYILILDRFGKAIDEKLLTLILLIVVAICSTAAAVFYDGFNFEHIKAGIIPILIIGIFCTGIVTLFQTKAQKVASPESVGILLLGEPLFTLVMAFYILHETILAAGVAGGALILLSLVLAVMKKL